MLLYLKTNSSELTQLLAIRKSTKKDILSVSVNKKQYEIISAEKLLLNQVNSEKVAVFLRSIRYFVSRHLFSKTFSQKPLSRNLFTKRPVASASSTEQKGVIFKFGEIFPYCLLVCSLFALNFNKVFEIFSECWSYIR